MNHTSSNKINKTNKIDKTDLTNIKLTIQYDGTRYQGWKRPDKGNNEHTVSHKIETVLEKLTGTPITLYSGTRTEPGVHAEALIINCFVPSSFSARKLRTELNQYLPQDISVLSAESVPDRFRADLNAHSRTYEYRICTAPVYDVFTTKFRDHIFPAPDVQKMQDAARQLLGRHDFKNFSSVKKKKGTEKELTEITFLPEKEQLTIRLTANDFLYSMAPAVIGTLLEIGLEQCSSDCIEQIFSGKKKAGNLCNFKGLFLTSVSY